MFLHGDVYDPKEKYKDNSEEGDEVEWFKTFSYGTEIPKECIKKYPVREFPNHTEEFKTLLKDFNQK